MKSMPIKTFANKLGLTLANHRRAKGLTQEQLAEHLSVEQETISRFERGATLPPLPRLLRLADLLNVPLVDLLGTCSPRQSDQIADIARSLQSLDEENREWVRQLVVELCNRLSGKNITTINMPVSFLSLPNNGGNDSLSHHSVASEMHTE
ncbi:helix-turn-helix domain-containing protein [Corticimicrobacter populi]|nr:helix-turn-helix transcriptional regulator [Corticimicrobacter populi]